MPSDADARTDHAPNALARAGRRLRRRRTCGLRRPGDPVPVPGPVSIGQPNRAAEPITNADPHEGADTPPETPTPTTDPDALRRKIGRLLIVGFRGLTVRPADPITRAVKAGLGGVILFDRDRATGSRNVKSPGQLAALTASLRAAAPGSLIVAIDQEGGRVSRLTPERGFPDTRSQAEIGATDDPDEAFEAGRSMGATMAAAGIDLDLAPVVDVNVNPTNPAIGALDRSFSGDPSIVAAMAEAEIRGLHEHGVRAAIKHFPGSGAPARTPTSTTSMSPEPGPRPSWSRSRPSSPRACPMS